MTFGHCIASVMRKRKCPRISCDSRAFRVYRFRAGLRRSSTSFQKSALLIPPVCDTRPRASWMIWMNRGFWASAGWWVVRVLCWVLHLGYFERRECP